MNLEFAWAFEESASIKGNSEWNQSMEHIKYSFTLTCLLFGNIYFVH